MQGFQNMTSIKTQIQYKVYKPIVTVSNQFVLFNLFVFFCYAFCSGSPLIRPRPFRGSCVMWFADLMTRHPEGSRCAVPVKVDTFWGMFLFK